MLPYVCEGDALAAGSYGKVYKGHKAGEPGTVVAIKVLRSHSEVGGATLSKEAREREALHLQEAAYPHIITYIAHFWVRSAAGAGAGAALSYAEATDADSLHLVTEFAARGTLALALAGALHAGPAALAAPAHLDAVRCYTAQLLSALRHLHDDCVIVHRDVKPINILLCDGGCEHGTVKLADLGSARTLDLHGDPRSTVAAGTCDFMAPETLARHFREMEGVPCDDLPRPGAPADVWSAGALLAEVALGVAAFSAALKGAGGRVGLLPRLQAVPAWAALPEDVQRVLRRCLAGAPEARATAAQLLEDPQLAGPWCQQPHHNPPPLPSTATFVWVKCGAGGQFIKVPLSGLTDVADLVERVLERVIPPSAGAHISSVRLRCIKGEGVPLQPMDSLCAAGVGMGMQLLVEWDALHPPVPVQHGGGGGGVAVPPASPAAPPAQPVPQQQQSPNSLGAPSAAAFGGGGDGGAAAPPAPAPAAGGVCPSCRKIPRACGSCPSCHKATCTCIKPTVHCVETLKHGGDVYGLAVLEGGRLVSGGASHTHLCVWDLATGVNVATMKGKGFKIAALPGGRFVAAGYDTKKAEVWDPASPARPICEYTGHTDNVFCVASLPNNLVASGSADRTVHIWKADTGAHVATLQGHTCWVFALAVLSDGRLASFCSETVRLWDVSHPASATRVLKQNSVFNDYAIAALDGGILAIGCTDWNVYLWDVKSASDKPMAVLEGHTKNVFSLAALPRGLLASGSYDKTVRVWNVAARKCVAVLQGHTSSVYALAVLPDGRLASGSSDGDIRMWAQSLQMDLD